jgi:hypothetical protein
LSLKNWPLPFKPCSVDKPSRIAAIAAKMREDINAQLSRPKE